MTSATLQSAPDPTLGACVVAAFKKASFRKTARGGSFSYPFVFTAPAPIGAKNADRLNQSTVPPETAHLSGDGVAAGLGTGSGLDRAAISAGVAQVKPRITACDTTKTASGTVKVMVVVAPDGKVTSATLQSAPEHKLGACVVGVIKGATFGKTAQGGSFSYPFVFGAPTASPPAGSGPPPMPKDAAVGGGTALDRTMISAGVAAIKTKISACGTATPVKGSVKVAVTVAPSGAVANVEVKAAPDGKLGACVGAEMKKAKFAATGQGGSFTYPFVF